MFFQPKSIILFRLIILILVLSSLILIFTTGFFYYSYVKKNILADIEKRMNLQLETACDYLSTFISENLNTSKALAGMDTIKNVFRDSNSNNKSEVVKVLNIFRNSYEVDVCYLIDKNGNAIASSESNTLESFIGKNYSFRPYFQKAINGESCVYMGIGITSNQRGIYYSQPVFGISSNEILGVVVTKNTIDNIEKKISKSLPGTWTFTNPDGLIFASNRKDWRVKLMWKLDESRLKKLAETKQFGSGPWDHIKIEKLREEKVVNKYNQVYLIKEASLYNYPHWRIYYLKSFKTAFDYLSDPFFEHKIPLIFIAGFSIGVFIVLLYWSLSLKFNKNKKIKQILKKQNSYLSAINEIYSGLIKRKNIDDLIEKILYRSGNLTGTKNSFFLMLDDQTNDFLAKIGYGKFSSIVGMRLKTNHGLSGYIFQTGKSLFISDYNLWSKKLNDKFFNEINSIISVPIKRQDVVTGILGLAHFDKNNFFAKDEMEFLEKIGKIASIAYDNTCLYSELQIETKNHKNSQEELTKLYQRIERLAVVDELTQLPNRRKFYNHLENEWRRMAREKKPLSFILCDIDLFKQYNYYYGHKAGDDCVRKIADVISSNVKRSGDLATRYDNEKFGIILSNTPIEGALKLARQMCKAVNDLKIDFCESNISSYLTISAGISCFVPDGNTSSDLLIETTYKALSEAKNNGRNQAFCYMDD